MQVILYSAARWHLRVEVADVVYSQSLDLRGVLKWKPKRFPLFFGLSTDKGQSKQLRKRQMINQELLRIIDNIARDKSIDRESVFLDLEEAMVSAAKKHFGRPDSEITIQIDRETGEVTAYKDNEPIDITQLGRISAQTAKQVIIQKIRADERESIYAEFIQRKGEIISGSVVRYEAGSLVVNLDHRTEGFMPKAEQIMGQSHRPGERIRCLILNVIETSGHVKIILSRTHPDFIRRLFELEVPEIAEGIIEIRALSREAGYRTKVAVISLDEKVDPVGACVGVRGSRIKNTTCLISLPNNCLTTYRCFVNC